MTESWFFNNSGYEKLSELKGAYESNTLNLVNERLQEEYKTYSPWMSHLDQTDVLKLFYTEESLFFTPPEECNDLFESLYIPQENKGSRLTFGFFTKEEKSLLKRSLELIKSTESDISRVFNRLIKHIVPINTNGEQFQDIGIGFSSHLAKGTIFIGFPRLGELNELQLAINLAHELGHQSLYLYQSADLIIDGDIDKEVFSYVRNKMRPAVQSFHALIAIVFMLRFLDQYQPRDFEIDFFHEYFKTLKQDAVFALKTFENIKFTDFGETLFEDVRLYVRSL